MRSRSGIFRFQIGPSSGLDGMRNGGPNHVEAESLSWYSLDLEKHSCTPLSTQRRFMPANNSSAKGSVSSMRETTSITIFASPCKKNKERKFTNGVKSNMKFHIFSEKYCIKIVYCDKQSCVKKSSRGHAVL